MSATPNELQPPRRRPTMMVGLVAISGGTLGLSLLLAFTSWGHALSPAVANVLQLANVGISGIALALTATIARRELRHDSPALDQLITVCAWTRRVQWQGRWISFEEYLAKRFDLRCTHGICEEAAERMREDMARTEMTAELRRG